jgi:hypothetical protein
MIRNTFTEIQKVKHYFGDIEIDGKVIWRRVLKKQDVRMCIGFNWRPVINREFNLIP